MRLAEVKDNQMLSLATLHIHCVGWKGKTKLASTMTRPQTGWSCNIVKRLQFLQADIFGRSPPLLYETQGT